jgi:integrase/recombinase XerD
MLLKHGVRSCQFSSGASIVQGKGRRERCLPLWKVTATAVRAWLAVRGIGLAPELFLNARGQPLTRSGFEYILDKHVQMAATACPSLSTKRVSPHVLRHMCALTVLQATKDLRKVSLWLGQRRHRDALWADARR